MHNDLSFKIMNPAIVFTCLASAVEPTLLEHWPVSWGSFEILQRGREKSGDVCRVKLYADPRNLKLVQAFSETFCDRQAEIAFLGIWDTVKSVYRFEPRGPELSSVSCSTDLRQSSRKNGQARGSHRRASAIL